MTINSKTKRLAVLVSALIVTAAAAVPLIAQGGNPTGNPPTNVVNAVFNQVDTGTFNVPNTATKYFNITNQGHISNPSSAPNPVLINDAVQNPSAAFTVADTDGFKWALNNGTTVNFQLSGNGTIANPNGGVVNVNDPEGLSVTGTVNTVQLGGATNAVDAVGIVKNDNFTIAKDGTLTQSSGLVIAADGTISNPQTSRGPMSVKINDPEGTSFSDGNVFGINDLGIGGDLNIGGAINMVYSSTGLTGNGNIPLQGFVANGLKLQASDTDLSGADWTCAPDTYAYVYTVIPSISCPHTHTVTTTAATSGSGGYGTSVSNNLSLSETSAGAHSHSLRETSTELGSGASHLHTILAESFSMSSNGSHTHTLSGTSTGSTTSYHNHSVPALSGSTSSNSGTCTGSQTTSLTLLQNKYICLSKKI